MGHVVGQVMGGGGEGRGGAVVRSMEGGVCLAGRGEGGR